MAALAESASSQPSFTWKACVFCAPAWSFNSRSRRWSDPVTVGGEATGLSPGQHPKHYQPRTRVILTINPPGRAAYLWHTLPHESAKSLRMPANAANYAAVLYSTLHDLDNQSLDYIAIEPPPDLPEWAGIRDRLNRATAE